ncbi:MAG: peptidoglycan DD-metalloendopeptidase family protein [Nostocaceae cyanobacterium]|nr:peptidoglycan DD-metalloendopeptidase family protein [Nostocaceae cyanobacterium]
MGLGVGKPNFQDNPHRMGMNYFAQSDFIRASFLGNKSIVAKSFNLGANWKRIGISLAFCLLLYLLITLALGLPATATPKTKLTTPEIDSLREQQESIDQQREGVTQERDRLTNIEQAARERLTGLEQNLQLTGNQIQDIEYRLQLANQRLEQLEADLVVAEQKYKQQQDATASRLRYLQRSPVSQGWAVLLQSQNLNEFLDRRRRLKLVYESDQQILAKLTEEGVKISQQKTEVEKQKNAILLIREQLLAQKSDFEAQTLLQQDLISRLNSDRFALEAAQYQLDSDSQTLGLLIQGKVAEAEARERAAKARSRNRLFVRGTGIFTFPSDASISSEFGWRVHPILGYRRFHSGLDFAGSYGSTIRTADSGTVIFAGWYGGYGKTVIINHGKGITTLYAHTSDIYVSEGQEVRRGQSIAAVGSTGLSTGPHLHFEVRENGEPKDPANYL